MRLSLPRRRVLLPAAALLVGIGGLALAGPSTAATASGLLPDRSAAPVATYAAYPAGPGQADGAGEPSIGHSATKDTTVFQSNLDTYRVTFDAPTAGASTWTPVSNPAGTTSLDPILFTDRQTGRTFSSQLLTACSQTAFSDDLSTDSPTWTPSSGCGLVTLFDHQTLGGGPYTPGSAAGALAAAAGYPHSVFYCAQYSVSANCARSDDGGLTFGAGVPIYNVPGVDDNAVLGCAGLHGHLRVSPDGSVYVPNFDCSGKVAVSVSEDDGTTWHVRPVPQSTTQDESDPSIAAGAKGTLYMAWEDGASTAVGSVAKVGVSRDHGRSWTDVQDLGAAFGVKNVQFPEVIAGDDDRAAVAFIGSTTGGDDQQGGSGTGTAVKDVFPGTWDMYVATTYDGGKTWSTVDATPTDPVQRGCVWLGGGSTSCRNLLDFNDITLDQKGYVLVGWADGCVAACITTPLSGSQVYDDAAHAPAYRANHGTITRQTGGLPLFAADDPVAPGAPALPTLASR